MKLASYLSTNAAAIKTTMGRVRSKGCLHLWQLDGACARSFTKMLTKDLADIVILGSGFGNLTVLEPLILADFVFEIKCAVKALSEARDGAMVVGACDMGTAVNACGFPMVVIVLAFAERAR